MAFNLAVLKLPTLKVGSQGEAVRAWQNFLREKDYSVGAADGQFGPNTEQVTKLYQQRHNLTPTGVVDNNTYPTALNDGFIYKVPNFSANLLFSYLRLGEPEIKELQGVLNTIIEPNLTVDGDFGPRSQKGLAQAYKQRDVRLRSDLESRMAATKRKLGDDYLPALDMINGYAKRLRFRLSGAHWVEYFPTSRSINDLASPFRERVQAFQKALLDGGAQVIVAATYRPRERAYLMHYAARISRGNIAAANVPGFAGVDIDWVHYTNAGSVQAAQEMADTYGVGGNPVALESRHTQRLAIDWNITWNGVMKVKQANGTVVNVGAPQNAANNGLLHRIGRSYGVIKLLNDPPHWSNDGR